MKKLTPKRIGIVAVVIGLIGLVAYGFVPQAVTVDTDTVTRGRMEVIIEEEGLTRVVDRFVVTSPVAGYAQRFGLQAGDKVEEDQALVTIEAMPADALNPQRRAEAEARVAAAQSALQGAMETARAAQADAALASKELQRIQGLFDGDAATLRDVETAEAAAQRASAQKTSADFSVEVAQHNLEAAKTALRFSGQSGGGQRVEVKSPIAGSVLQINHESAGVVAAGTAIVEIGDASRLEVAVDVLSQDATRIEAGMKVRFARWGGDEELTGVVRTIQPTGFTKMSALGVEEQRVWVIVDFASDPKTWRRLGDRYHVVAQFVVWAEDDVLQTQSSAIFRKGDGWAAFQVMGGRAVETPVQVGKRSGLTIQILDGLEEGAVVVVHPPTKLEDGSRVEAM